jgi:DNA-binding beta-propeller fold protein YncE
VAVSPDGKSVYVASGGSDAVARFARNTTTGALTQPVGPGGCVSETGAGNCVDGHALDEPQGLALTRDGKSLYAASGVSDAVVRFARHTTTGALTQPAGPGGCVSETGAGNCADGHALDGPTSVAASSDGKSVYVGSAVSHAVARLNRDVTTGAITQPVGPSGCVSQPGFFGAAEPCADGHALGELTSVVVSPDGKNVYAVSQAHWAVDRFNRNTTTGAITQPSGTNGCVSELGNFGCARAHGLESAIAVTISPSGKSVYATSAGYNAVARFNRAP